MTETRKNLSEILERDKASLVSPKEGDLDSRTLITYLCGMCRQPHTKVFNNLKNGAGGGLCPLCAQKRGNERRIASLNVGPKWSINRDLATRTATKDGSELLGIYRKEADGSYTIFIDDNRITRDCYLHIRCQCGDEGYVHFRAAHGHGAVKPGEGLCLCAGCRKGHKAAALRKARRGDDSTTEDVIESPSKRAARIERDGQKCTDCKKKKPAADFARVFNLQEKCKVYKGRCYACSRKLRTSNREDALRNGSVEEFMKGELVIAKDRNKKYTKKYPDDARDFDITLPFLMDLFERQYGKCALSGLPMLTITHRDECPEDQRCNPNKLSIDRIDSSCGYTEDNVQLVRWRANSMKMDVTYAEYKEEIRAQYEHLFSK